MKKILIATDSFLPRWDGIARFLNEIVPRLEEHYKINILAPKFNGQFDWLFESEITRFQLSGIMVADYPLSKPSIKTIKSEIGNSDIVWVHTIGPIGIITIIAAKAQKKKTIAYIHAIEWELFPKSIRSISITKWIVLKTSSLAAKYFYNKCSLLMVPSDGIADLLERKGIHTPKMKVPLGTNPKTFTPPSSKADAKRALGIDPEKIVIGYAGRIGLEKDLITLYRAFGRINRKHDAILLIAGQDMNGITKPFATNNKVMVTGLTNNIVPYLQAMDIYVLPSLTETSSLSTLEAMSCQLAVLTTKVGSVKEYIRDGFNGMFFEKKNAYQLAKKLDMLITNEPLRKIMGENARRTVINSFTWEKTVEKLKEVFDEI